MSALDRAVVEALVIILVVAACRWFNRHRDAVPPADLLSVLGDPYAIAWLRGCSTAVLQLAAYDLVVGRRLAVVPAGSATVAGAARAHAAQLVPLPGRPGEDDLAVAARQLLALVTDACDHARLVGFARDLEPGFADCDRTLATRGLLLTAAQRLAGWLVTAVGMAVVLGVALWLFLGDAHAAEGGMLAVTSLAAIGLCALWLAGAPEHRMSPRGRACLAGLAREAGADAGRRHAQRWTAAAAGDQALGGAPTPSSAPALMEVACAGPIALNGTAYAGLVALLDPALAAPGPPGFQESPDDEGGRGERPSERQDH